MRKLFLLFGILLCFVKVDAKPMYENVNTEESYFEEEEITERTKAKKDRLLSVMDDFIQYEKFKDGNINKRVYVRLTPKMDDNIYMILDKSEDVLIKDLTHGVWREVLIDDRVMYVHDTYIKEKTKQIEKPVEPPKSEKSITVIPKVDIPVDSGYKYYNIGGWCYPDENLTKYLYQQLTNRGVAWYYPYAVAQICQESNWNPNSTNGRDHGLCQFKGIYWDNRAALAGLPGADIWNPYDSLYVYAWFMSELLRATNYDIPNALSLYITGVAGEYHELYVNSILRWYNDLR